MAGRYLTTAPFPNTTTLYGWNINGGSDVSPIPNAFGSIDLTRTGALTSGTDHTGASTFCTFDGTNDWLSSSDAAFNFTGTFSIGGWFNSTDWTPASAQYMISRASAAVNGWDCFLNTDGTMVFRSLSGAAATSSITIPNPSFTNGTWHHIVFVRNAGQGTAAYVDGTLSTTNSDATDTITAGGNLEIGSSAGGTLKWNGMIQDVFVHNGTLFTPQDVKNIYRHGVGTTIFVTG
jgi:hypothetical protein